MPPGARPAGAASGTSGRRMTVRRRRREETVVNAEECSEPADEPVDAPRPADEPARTGAAEERAGRAWRARPCGSGSCGDRAGSSRGACARPGSPPAARPPRCPYRFREGCSCGRDRAGLRRARSRSEATAPRRCPRFGFRSGAAGCCASRCRAGSASRSRAPGSAGERPSGPSIVPATAQPGREVANVALGAAVAGIGSMRVDEQNPHQPAASMKSRQTRRAVSSHE